MNFILALSLLFSVLENLCSPRKDEYWRGANVTFVSTSTQDCGRMRGFGYTLKGRIHAAAALFCHLSSLHQLHHQHRFAYNI